MKKAMSWHYPQRVDGWCKSMIKKDGPLSKPPMKVGRVSPLSLFERSGETDKLGGNAGDILSSLFWGRGFFCAKKPSVFRPKRKIISLIIF